MVEISETFSTYYQTRVLQDPMGTCIKKGYFQKFDTCSRNGSFRAFLVKV